MQRWPSGGMGRSCVEKLSEGFTQVPAFLGRFIPLPETFGRG